jgi:16S rRNA (adenine1518-N6/adenine1519-N6)-dimethyltransferase
MVQALDPAPGQLVLEIGAGPGTLTQALLRRGARVVAVELDRDLAAMLRDTVPAAQIVEGDALALDWAELVGTEAGRHLVTGNIPYHITSPLLDRALEPPRPQRVVFLVQKEVADRLTAQPGTAAYGALSVGVQAVCTVERLFTVPAGAFHPAPRVDSTVIRLTPRAQPLVQNQWLRPFRSFVTGLFGMRRKQLLRALRELTSWPADRVGAILSSSGLLPTRRAETLSPAQMAELFRALVDAGWEVA